MSALLRGDWATRARIVSGLILFLYVTAHFLNIGLGLISSTLAETVQNAKGVAIRSGLGTVLLYGALAVHVGASLWRLSLRRTLWMPFGEAVQTVLGLAIPFILLAHITHTRAAHEIFGVNDDIGYIAGLIWDTPDGWWQAALILIVWVHGCLGLHYWLRMTSWWRNAWPTLVGLAALVPAFALAGFMAEGRRMKEVFADPGTAQFARDQFNFPDRAAFGVLKEITDTQMMVAIAILGAVAAVMVGRRLVQRWRSIEVTYSYGPKITVPKGSTLLEMSRSAGVPHAALCGGRGRCTTCRVMIEIGAEHLPEPSEAEVRALAAVKAAPGARLACQLRPANDLTITRMFRPDGRRDRAHASTGEERELAILFLDMRGFTARTTGQLPYDIVFLLNRFFDAIVPAITAAGGTVDKYLGDGLLAVFEAPNTQRSALAALKAAEDMGHALADFNKRIALENSDPVRIGVGLHVGQIVLGEIGAQNNAPRTIIGDAVNAASRLEAQTKELGVELLISHALLSAAGKDHDGLTYEVLTLRGVDAPVEALQVADMRALPKLLDAEPLAAAQ